MKAILTLMIAGAGLVGCGQQIAGNSSTHSSNTRSSAGRAHVVGSNGDVGIPELTRYIATVKHAKACAKKIAAIGAIEITSVFKAIDVVAFTAIPEDSELVAKLQCVLAVELDREVVATSSNAGKNDVQIPELTGYIATVENTKECTKQIESIGSIEITSVLETIGVVTFTSIPEQSKLVAKLPCVVAVELDGRVVANPSTRIGN